MLLFRRFIQHFVLLPLIYLTLSSCYHAPYNNFLPYNRTFRDLAMGAGVGSAVGAVVGPTLAGTAIGAGVFAAYGLHQESKSAIIAALQQLDIQYYQYGDTMSLIVPTDRYYRFNSARLNELCYPGLMLIVKLLHYYDACGPIYVAGFTDNIGSRYHKKMLSQARAEMMVGFLWANGFKARRLNGEGYGDKYAVSDNHIIHGSSQNRRIEIQWFACPTFQAQPYFYGPTK